MNKLKAYADFIFEVGALARTPRSGFRHLGTQKQSIAEHLLRTTYIGFVLAHMEEQAGEKVDIGKVVECCLFHDLGEARALDLDYISQKYSQSDELKAVQDAVKDLPFADRIIQAYLETEERSTKEGMIAKDADQIELISSLKELTDDGNKRAGTWIPATLKRLKTTSAQKLADELLNTDSDDWWFVNREDEYWIKGGKKHSK